MTPHPQQRAHDHWRRTLEDAVRAAPFGDVPKAKAPPFSVTQASGLLSSAEVAKFSEAQLQRLAADALRELEDRSRHAIESWLEDQVAFMSRTRWDDGDGSVDAGCFPHCVLLALPAQALSTICERFGPQVVRASMQVELCTCATMSDGAVLDAGVASFQTLARFAQRSAHWEALLLRPEDERRRCCADGVDARGGGAGDGAAVWPDASAWHRVKRLASSTHHARPPAAPALRCEVLSIEPRSAGTRRKRTPAATSSAEPVGHWEVRIRIQRDVDASGEEGADSMPGEDATSRSASRSAAACIRRITIAEDLYAAWPEAFTAMPRHIANHLEHIATRDVHFAPPLRLNGPRACAVLALKLPRTQPREPCPSVRVLEVASFAGRNTVDNNVAAPS